jgi:CubicO group peptidase (beta-lactamase class C family)
MATELSGPLGLDAWIGLPSELEPRVEPLVGGITPEPSDDVDPSLREMLAQLMGPESTLGRALSCNGGLAEVGVFNTPELRAAQLPAANGVTDARSLSPLYAALVGPVEADERFPAAARVLAPETVAAATVRQTSGNDAVLFFESTFGLGFMTSSPFSPYGGAAGFGHAGAGGSVGFADPDAGLGCGYVMSKMQQNLSGDPRSTSLIRATYATLGLTPAHG